ncbi:MAG TPA: DUF1559 domain-containing protein [Urbifossiella sp.]|nr:DUF1559 domain-containing protein [Urbifossiella sp.]
MIPRLTAPAAFAVVAAVALAQPAPQPAPLPAGVKAFASLNVAELWDHKALAPARESRGKIEFAWAVQAMVGLGPTDLDRLTLFWPDAGSDSPFVVVVGRKAVTAAAVAKALSRPGPAVKPAPGPAVPVVGGEFESVYPVDARTLLLTPKGTEPAKLAAAVALVPALRTAAGKHALTVGLDAAALAGLPLPRPLSEARTAVVTVDLGPDAAAVRLTARFAGDAAAKSAEPALAAKLRELAAFVAAEAKKAEARPVEGNAYPAPLLEFLAKTTADAKVRTDGASVVGTADVKLDDAVALVLTALPEPALSPRGVSAAQYNLKEIGLAMHSFHDINGHFAGNIYDKDDKALLSWRVQLLPYLEQTALHQRFKLDEAWDSPANKAASQTVVRMYQTPGRPTKLPWETYFQTFTSPKDAGEHRALLLDGQPKGAKMANVTDGLSNTFIVVEAGDAVPWAKPEDLPYDGKMALPKLGGPSGSFAVVMGDGSTRTFRRSAIDPTTLRRAISIGDGNPINLP